MIETILAVLLSFVPFHTDNETIEQRTARMQPFAEALTTVHDRELLAAVIAVGEHESHYARYVAEGCTEGPHHCDHGRSKGYLQQQRTACPRVWLYPDGSPEALRESVSCAATLLGYGKRLCGSWAGAFAVYSGRGCGAQWSGAAPRLVTMKRVLAKL